MRRIKLALISCGLGHVSRGFEISTARWFETLKNEDSLDVRLFAGGGFPGATTVWNIHRDHIIARAFSSIVPFLQKRTRWELAYGLEQFSFSVGFIKDVKAWSPDVVWTKEVPLVLFLDIFRKTFGMSYKIIFANGAPFNPSTYRGLDYIQHLQPEAYGDARVYGLPDENMQVLPNCTPYHAPPGDRKQLRARFGYKENDWVVISVAAWNRYHKRIDYLINEVAEMKDPNVKLLLCGQPEPETPPLKKLAAERLPGRVQWLTLHPDEVNHALYASDCFALCSLNEGLGSALTEAAMSGLPVIAHPHPGSRYILQDERWLTDLSEPGGLARRLAQLKEKPPAGQIISELKKSTFDRFSQEALSHRFAQMVKSVACGKPAESPAADLVEVG